METKDLIKQEIRVFKGKLERNNTMLDILEEKAKDKTEVYFERVGLSRGYILTIASLEYILKSYENDTN